jgi:hypothetical protein
MAELRAKAFALSLADNIHRCARLRFDYAKNSRVQ